jgi:putative ABC transport system ATP-binding protein
MAAPSPAGSSSPDAAWAPIRAEQLERTYGTGPEATRALQGVTVRVQPGELVAIRGRSGSGKTTLLNLVAGLDDPDAGSVHLAGSEITGIDADARLRLRAADVGFVFQEAALVPELKLWENVAVAARIAGDDHERAREEALAALDLVGLDGLADRYPGEVSGGEAQRASVARALAKRPSVLLADEPTANLDHGTARTVADRIGNHVRGEDAAALVVTHDDVMADEADRVERLRDGRLEDADGG